jgi:hypothetical protein
MTENREKQMHKIMTTIMLLFRFVIVETKFSHHGERHINLCQLFADSPIVAIGRKLPQQWYDSRTCGYDSRV